MLSRLRRQHVGFRAKNATCRMMPDVEKRDFNRAVCFPISLSLRLLRPLRVLRAKLPYFFNCGGVGAKNLKLMLSGVVLVL